MLSLSFSNIFMTRYYAPAIPPNKIAPNNINSIINTDAPDVKKLAAARANISANMLYLKYYKNAEFLTINFV